jgi:hypothetical protein
MAVQTLRNLSFDFEARTKIAHRPYLLGRLVLALEVAAYQEKLSRGTDWRGGKRGVAMFVCAARHDWDLPMPCLLLLPRS